MKESRVSKDRELEDEFEKHAKYLELELEEMVSQFVNAKCRGPCNVVLFFYW